MLTPDGENARQVERVRETMRKRDEEMARRAQCSSGQCAGSCGVTYRLDNGAPTDSIPEKHPLREALENLAIAFLVLGVIFAALVLL